MINAHRIVYNNLSSDEFDVILGLSFDGDDGTTDSFLGREGVSTQHYDGHHTIHRAKYNEVFTPRFTLIKKDYGDFDPSENRKILSWLTSSDKPGWLEVYKDDSNVVEWRVFGCVTTIEQYKLGNGRIVGYEFEIESSHPYAWSNKFSYPSTYDETDKYLGVNGTESFKITCNTDEYNKLIYPKVIVDFNGDNIYFPVSTKPKDSDYMIPNVVYTFTETNKETGKLEDKHYVSISAEDVGVRAYVVSIAANADLDELSTSFPEVTYFHVVDGRDHTIRQIVDGKWKVIAKTGAAIKINTSYILGGTTVTKEVIISCAALGEKITLDGENKVISVMPDNNVRIMGDDFNWEWLPLAYGDNNITITGNCAVQIQWIEPRKVGSL